MASNLKDILAKIEQGSSWVSYDKISGTGPDKVAIKVEPGWMGRLPRETYVDASSFSSSSPILIPALWASSKTISKYSFWLGFE